MATMTTFALPTPEAIALADYKLGSFGSDLDAISTTLERCAGEEGADHYDPDALAGLVVFVTDVLQYLPTLQEEAEAIQQTAIGLYHEQHTGRTDPQGWKDYQESIRAWHEREAERA